MPQGTEEEPKLTWLVEWLIELNDTLPPWRRVELKRQSIPALRKQLTKLVDRARPQFTARHHLGGDYISGWEGVLNEEFIKAKAAARWEVSEPAKTNAQE